MCNLCIFYPKLIWNLFFWKHFARLNQTLARIVLGWPPFKIVYNCSVHCPGCQIWLFAKLYANLSLLWQKMIWKSLSLNLYKLFFRQPGSPFKLATITKNRNVFKWPKAEHCINCKVYQYFKKARIFFIFISNYDIKNKK